MVLAADWVRAGVWTLVPVTSKSVAPVKLLLRFKDRPVMSPPDWVVAPAKSALIRVPLVHSVSRT